MSSRSARSSSPASGSGQTAATSGAARSKAELQEVNTSKPRRSLGAFSTLLVFCVFTALLALAGLHAVLVQKQADLDDFVTDNVDRRERIDELLAGMAYLDSPQGLAQQASDAGLVPAPEIVMLVPTPDGLLMEPGDDPFGLIAAGVATEQTGHTVVKASAERSAG